MTNSAARHGAEGSSVPMEEHPRQSGEGHDLDGPHTQEHEEELEPHIWRSVN
ncbi:hypothetical protein [Streptomyces sp. NPDC060275]|uniref:hypothetical protein n=1 Tax=Streptomyces sp. NPDC060275 TaxID=3347090 RepID=UPI003658D6FD